MRARRAFLALSVVASTVAACGGSSGTPTLNWYINPDNGGQAQLAKACSDPGGRYRIKTSVLPNRYEGYMVWINALVASAGGTILVNPEAGKDVKPGIDSPAGREAAAVIRELARSKAADPALSTSKEESGRAAFQGPRGGFM